MLSVMRLHFTSSLRSSIQPTRDGGDVFWPPHIKCSFSSLKITGALDCYIFDFQSILCRKCRKGFIDQSIRYFKE